jgi:hypothetical protein
MGREVRYARGHVLAFSTFVVYNCNIINQMLGTEETENWSGIGETARAEGRNENENSDLHDRGRGEEGGGEGVQACHSTLAERPLCLFPGWRCPSAGCACG